MHMGGGAPVHVQPTPATKLKATACKYGRVALAAAIAYAACALAVGPALLPGSPAFALLLIWASAHVGSEAACALRLPALLGMLLAGVLLGNLPWAWAPGLPQSWGLKLRSGALAVILTRSGLDLDLPALKRAGWAAARLTVCPGITEALVVAGMATALFRMPIALSLTLGFILAAVSPAVVVSAMYDLQARGYGVDKGIPSIVIAAASLDDVVAITGYALCIGLAVPSGQPLALEIAHGPISVAAGLTVGGLAGVVVGSTRLWPSRRLRSFVTLLTGQLLMFVAVHFHYTGAGALGGLVMAVVASSLWARSDAPPWYRTQVGSELARETEQDIAGFWRWVAQPVLFGVIGTAVDFDVLSAASIPRAAAVVSVGVAARLPIAALVTFGAGLELKERLFIGGSWLAKATVQAALASAPLDVILDNKRDDPDFERWRRWGQDILTTAVFAIILTAPAGLLFINYSADKLLTRKPAACADELEVAADEPNRDVAVAVE